MHGRKKGTWRAFDSPEEEAAKIAAYSKLVGGVMAQRAAGATGEAPLGLTRSLLSVNPDFYSLWNFRRELVEAELAGGAELAGVTAEELSLTRAAIQKNPKSYGSWHHRRWVVAKGAADLEAELAECERLLQLDERNFHCWTYRQWLLRRADKPPQFEWDFTGRKIDANFSNYSAFHYRSALLPRIAGDHAELLRGELETVQQAVFTEPDDQSAWFYQRWLLGYAARVEGIDVAALLREQVEWCRELVDMEEGSKWGLSTLAWLLGRLAAVAGDEAAAGEARQLYAQLAELDADHAVMYAYQAGQL